MAVETPHFGHPFRFETKPNGDVSAAVDEQHSDEEIVGCVMRIVSYERGYRDELPAFGVSDPTFEQAPIESEKLVSEIEEWEDRPALKALAAIDTDDESVHRVRVAVEIASGEVAA
jgi:hypothetical protein